MNGSNMRDKARAIFGKAFFENTKEPAPAKNAAVALQKRANARPIPTYKVGGVVKKKDGGALTAAEKARAEKMIRERGDAAMRDPLVMRLLDEQNRAPMSVPGMGPKAATKRAEGGGIEAQRLEARADAGRYKHGGKIKKKADGGVMEEYDTMPSSVRQAGYQQAAPAYGEYGAGPKPMQQMVANPNPIAPAYKKGGKVKNGLAVMIAIGKQMKGMKKPVKKADGGMPQMLKGEMPKGLKGQVPELKPVNNVHYDPYMGPGTKIYEQMRARERALKEKVTKENMAGFKGRLAKNSAALNARMAGFKDRIGAPQPVKKAEPIPLDGFKDRIGAPQPVKKAEPIPLAKGGAVMKPVKKAVGGPAATAAPKAPSALLNSLKPQDYQKAQAARAAAATPAAKAAARAKATANIARDSALKTRMSQNAQRAAAQKQNYAASNANIKSGFIGKQAEINKMKAANAAKIAQNNQKRAANATARAANQARQVELNRQAAARTPIKRAAGGAAKVRKGQMKGC